MQAVLQIFLNVIVICEAVCGTELFRATLFSIIIFLISLQYTGNSPHLF